MRCTTLSLKIMRFYYKLNYEDILTRFLIETHKNLNTENKELNFMG
jgi:hypothetical protein